MISDLSYSENIQVINVRIFDQKVCALKKECVRLFGRQDLARQKKFELFIYQNKMNLYSTKNACITVSLLKESFFMSSYPGKIIFGEVNEYNYIPKKHFILCRSKYISLYKSIVHILNASTSKDAPVSGIITENVSQIYKWEATTNGVLIELLENSKCVYNCPFTFEELNNFFDSFNELMASSLLLKQNEIEVFDILADLSLEKLVTYEKQQDLLYNEVVVNLSQTSNTLTFVKMNYDLIFLKHKLKLLVKTDYRQLSNLVP